MNKEYKRLSIYCSIGILLMIIGLILRFSIWNVPPTTPTNELELLELHLYYFSFYIIASIFLAGSATLGWGVLTFNAKENIPEKIKKNNENHLADFVILCAGVEPAVKQALHSVKAGGTILWFAPTKPGIDIPFPFFDVWNKQIKMFSTYAGAGRDITEAIELLRSKKVVVTDMITHKLPMKDAAKGFKLMAEAKKSMKIIIEPNK